MPYKDKDNPNIIWIYTDDVIEKELIVAKNYQKFHIKSQIYKALNNAYEFGGMEYLRDNLKLSKRRIKKMLNKDCRALNVDVDTLVDIRSIGKGQEIGTTDEMKLKDGTKWKLDKLNDSGEYY